MLSSSDL
jgi:hypothetical protein